MARTKTATTKTAALKKPAAKKAVTEQKTNKNPKSNLFQRVVTAVILAPLVIGSIVLGFPYYNLLVLVTGAILSFEWSNMTAKENRSVYAVTYTSAMATAVLLQSWTGLFIMLAAALIFVYLKAKGEAHRLLISLGVLYISIGIGSLMWILEYTNSSLGVLWLLLVVWSVDIGGFVFGCSIKGPKLAPSISPNKTWAGLLGGMTLAALVGGVFAYIIDGAQYCHYYAIMAAVLAVIEQIGDLIESAIKRRVGVKDSSNIIPGHGGMFDRIDGLIFTAPILLACIILNSMYMF
ncbi:MAG: phosphatidate cytidylyltransferase [Alphaproteobacteria bacterium]|nr:phosphatidate cytidylyltransferase [Alphaproteobacteria bacterium]